MFIRFALHKINVNTYKNTRSTWDLPVDFAQIIKTKGGTTFVHTET
jgi:hypothetical protein